MLLNIICIFFQIYDFAKTVNFRHVDCYCNLSKPVSYLKTPFLFNEKNVSSIIWYLEYHANSQFEFQYFFLLGQIYRYIIFDIMQFIVYIAQNLVTATSFLQSQILNTVILRCRGIFLIFLAQIYLNNGLIMSTKLSDHTTWNICYGKCLGNL